MHFIFIFTLSLIYILSSFCIRCNSLLRRKSDFWRIRHAVFQLEVNFLVCDYSYFWSTWQITLRKKTKTKQKNQHIYWPFTHLFWNYQFILELLIKLIIVMWDVKFVACLRWMERWIFKHRDWFSAVKFNMWEDNPFSVLESLMSMCVHENVRIVANLRIWLIPTLNIDKVQQ